MTNNKIFDRLCRLFEMLGANLEKESADTAEIRAYCAGMDMILQDYKDKCAQINIDTAYDIGLSLYCGLFRIDSSLDDAVKKAKIKEGLQYVYGDYSPGEFDDALKAIDSGIAVSSNNFNLNISGSALRNSKNLKRVAQVLEDYVPPCTFVSFDGFGADFDYWDSSQYLFEDYDNMNMAFQLLDTLNK